MIRLQVINRKIFEKHLQLRQQVNSILDSVIKQEASQNFIKNNLRRVNKIHLLKSLDFCLKILC